MSKKFIDIDDDVLAEAARVLGARTVKETVNEALAEVVRLATRRAHADRLADMHGIDLHDQDVMARAWR